ncbi:MAG: chalcone isomerase family protein [Candidatus Competibacter sp.]
MFEFLFGKRKVAESQAKKNFSFPDSVMLDNVQLARNGEGVRKRFGMEIYEMALYLSSATTDARQAIALPGPKQLRFVAKRRLVGGMLGTALLNGMRKNLPVGQEAFYLPYIGEIVKIFKTEPDIREGQTFRIDLLPDRGTHFYIADQLKGKPIQASGFNEAVLAIWLGRRPVDADLKRNLLAGVAK